MDQAGVGNQSEGIQGAYPNPFSGSLQIQYVIGGASDARVSIRIYNVAGRLVRALVDGADVPGRHTITWDGRTESGDSSPRGIYFVRFRIAGSTQTLRIIRIQ